MYSKGGYLYVRTGSGRVIATRMPDTQANRRLAQRMKKHLWLDELTGAAPVHAVRICDAWERFVREWNAGERTMKGYARAYGIVVTDTQALVTTEMLTRFAADFRREPWSGSKGTWYAPATVNNILRHYRTFTNWCVETYSLQPVNISRQMVREEGVNPVVLTPDQLTNAPRHLHMPLFLFMACTGGRPVDVMTITPERIDRTACTIAWRNKITKRDEVRPVHPDALAWLDMMPEYTYTEGRVATVSSAMRRATGWRLKWARSTFLALIDTLPYHMQVYLMRHHPQGVTERHYRAHDLDAARTALATLWLPTPRNVLAYKDTATVS